jgi:hypothetical protein
MHKAKDEKADTKECPTKEELLAGTTSNMSVKRLPRPNKKCLLVPR